MELLHLCLISSKVIIMQVYGQNYSVLVDFTNFTCDYWVIISWIFLICMYHILFVIVGSSFDFMIVGSCYLEALSVVEFCRCQLAW